MSSFLFSADKRTESERFDQLLQNGIGASFSLSDWSIRSRTCSMKSTRERLTLLFEPCRTAVSKLIVMQALEHDEERCHLQEQCVYAEITVASFETILSEHMIRFLPVSQPSQLKFFDLGSGTGKNVFLAAISGLFHTCIGIEILPELAAIGNVLHESFLEDVVGVGAKHFAETKLYLDSFTENTEWVQHADVVYCNTIMFDATLMASLATLAHGMKEGSIFITLGQSLMPFLPEIIGSSSSLSSFQIVETFATNHSFGSGVDTFLHRHR